MKNIEQQRNTLGNKIFALALIAVICASIGAMIYFNPIAKTDTVTHIDFGVGTNKLPIIDVYDYVGIDGVLYYVGHHDANKTSIGLDWLVNRTTGFGNNASQTMIYVGWSNSTENCGASTTHISWIFNDTNGQGNGLGIKTLTSANWTRWTTYGKFNLTAKAYCVDTTAINNIRKVFISFKAAHYNCFIAVDVISPVINLPTGGSSFIQSVFVIQFS